MKEGNFPAFKSFHIKRVWAAPSLSLGGPPKRVWEGRVLELLRRGVSFPLCSAGLSHQKQDFKGPRVKMQPRPLTKLPRELHSLLELIS